MRVHILGIGGTFMSGLALLAKQCGMTVSGSDTNVYPPMSTQLKAQNITYYEGYDDITRLDDVDCVIIGNVIRRGNPMVEAVLAQSIPYFSGPEWLFTHVLKNRCVLAVSGTHGKTTTASMLAWVLSATDKRPGFLIGGIPENFGVSAQLGESPFFVIEADEYDSAFFDKRSKFIHYHPRVLILNNLEFDHADIFPDLNAIKQQFSYLIKTIPNNGLIIKLAHDQHLTDVLNLGCWTPVTTFGTQSGNWQAKCLHPDGSVFDVYHDNKKMGTVTWQLCGEHNVNNALAVLAAACHIGIKPELAIETLAQFKNVKRRLEIKGVAKDIVIYDDFAHHPTAIATTLKGLRAKIGKGTRLIAVLEFGSYTMRVGTHKDQLAEALLDADMVICKKTAIDWGLQAALQPLKQPTAFYDNAADLIQGIVPMLQPNDHVVIMSNTGFENIHERLLAAIDV